jgi:hypothetical protein
MTYFNASNTLLERPGNFILTDVHIIPYHREGDEGIFRQIITDQVLELNIYESLESPFLHGDVGIIDGVNLISMLPLTGFERIEFKLYTPGEQRGYDFSVKSGHPMMITGIRNKAMLKDRTQSYTLEFCSMERVKNDLSKVSRAFTGTTDEAIQDLVRSDLDSKKNLIIEETKTVAKYIAPRVKPLHAIKQISMLSESKSFDNSGYKFYETGEGFHYKTFESMFCEEGGAPKPVRARYSPKIVAYRDEKGDRDIINALQAVSDFKIKSQVDTLRLLNYGTFASKTITHDSFNKTVAVDRFDYHLNYTKQNHLEEGEDKAVVPFFNFALGKTISDYADTKIHLVSGTSKVHNEYEYLGHSHNEDKRISQKAALSSIILEIKVPGFTGISVGEVVHFTHPSFKELKNSADKDNDPYLTGRYLITEIKHNVGLKMSKTHTMTVELVKDSYSVGLPEDNIDLFTGQENEEGLSYSQYNIDKA